MVLADGGALAAPAGLIGRSRPAKAGDVLTIYAAGLGAVSPPVADGHNSCDPDSVCAPDFSNMVLRTTTTEPTVFVSGVQVASKDLLFSGLAPQFAGVYQINFRVPAGVSTGDSVPITVRMGDITSRRDVTIAVQ